MTSLYLIILILFIGLLLYSILGGADFGGGILETFRGKSEIKVISKAIAPVWEANHVWLILVIVILFMGFPKVYAVLSNSLHIPLFIMLLGIVFRGSAFTFRYYNVQVEQNQLYTIFFRAGSVITPFFLGIIVGAVTAGEIIQDYTKGFYEFFIAPWLGIFPVTVGLFTVLLFAYLAAVFLSGEIEVEEERRKKYGSIARKLLITIVIAGLLVLGSSYYINTSFLSQFYTSTLNIICITLVTLSIPIMWLQLKRINTPWTRFIAGFQVTLILLGWFAVQFPVMVYVNGSDNLTIYNTATEPATLQALLWALIVGVLLIFPSLFYLYRVFKRVHEA
jgi:cytochrome d ubiquinol oxidase subunit II